ncbi:hypothetical protein I546_7347 [Mycobacterium kansasii 732]|nr:hypothetical protein I546_7347 [Mycobacterium kansasii 732]
MWRPQALFVGYKQQRITAAADGATNVATAATVVGDGNSGAAILATGGGDTIGRRRRRWWGIVMLGCWLVRRGCAMWRRRPTVVGQ